MHRLPPPWLYAQATTLLIVGVALIVLSVLQREWQPLAVGAGCVACWISFAVFLAWMRDRYNEWHPEDRGLVDDMGSPVSRVELASDTVATWIITRVWPSFRGDRDQLHH